MEAESGAGVGGGWRRGSFYPIVVGVTSETSAADSSSSDVAPRVVLVNPVTQSMALLHGDAAVAVAEILAARRRRSPAPPPPPASRASIDAMKTLQLVTTTEVEELVVEEEEEEEEEDCAVCLENMLRLTLIVKEMPCKHRFHGGCIDKWLMIHGSCPICRFRMPPEEAFPSGGCGGEEHQYRQ